MAAPTSALQSFLYEFLLGYCISVFLFLHATFTYDTDALDIDYNKKTKQWSIPLSAISKYNSEDDFCMIESDVSRSLLTADQNEAFPTNIDRA